MLGRHVIVVLYFHSRTSYRLGPLLPCLDVMSSWSSISILGRHIILVHCTMFGLHVIVVLYFLSRTSYHHGPFSPCWDVMLPWSSATMSGRHIIMVRRYHLGTSCRHGPVFPSWAPMGSPSRGGGVSRLSLPTPFSPIFVCPSAYRNLSPVLLFTHQLLPTYLQFSSSDCPFCLHRPFTYISLLYKPSFCHFSFSLWSTRDPAR